MIWAMSRPFVLPDRKRGRGNPNWGKPLLSIPVLVTEFEQEVARLRLKRRDYAASMPLKRWCYRNRNRVYVPEWLLDEWGMQVELYFSAA
jgi:hypothetical protein